MINPYWFQGRSMFGYAALAGILWALVLYSITHGQVIIGINMTWPDPTLFLAMCGLTLIFWPLMIPSMWSRTWFKCIAMPLLALTFFMWAALAISIMITFVIGLFAGRR